MKKPLIPSLSSIVLLLLLVNIHCKKTVPPSNILPPATQDGKNTFGCRVNGEVWTPYYSCGLIQLFTQCKELQSMMVRVDSSINLPMDLTLSASREIVQGSFSGFNIGVRISRTGNLIDSAIVLYAQQSGEYYRHPPGDSTGILNLTKLDTVNRIISGTFAFRLYNTWGDSVTVTDGRFDVTYNACLCH